METLLRDLLGKSFHAVLHRLRGLRALLGGWIEIGVPPGSEDRVHSRLEEDMALLARLDWIGSMMITTPPPERMEAGEAPGVLLAVALGISSAEEARARLPLIQNPRAAVAAALWLHASAPHCVLNHDARLAWEGRSLVIELTAVRPADLAEWDAAYASLILSRDPRRIVFRPGCFALQVEAEHAAGAV